LSKSSVRQRREERRIRKTKARKKYLVQRERYLETRRAIREIEKKEKITITPKPEAPAVRPIPKYEDYVQYIDVQFTYRASKSDKSRDVKRATYRVWGETRSSFDSTEYLAEKHSRYKLTGGAAWNVHVVGSGSKKQ